MVLIEGLDIIKLMSIWSKLSDNKAVTGVVAALGLGGLVYWAYKNYRDEQGQSEEAPAPKPTQVSNKQVATIEAQINKLKGEINLADPSLEDIKKILTTLANHVKNKTMTLSNRFKEERRKRFPKAKRFSDMGEYYRFSNEGLMNLQNAIMALQGQQQNLMASIGINQAVIAKYAAELGPFMQELVFDSSISLEEVKKSIEIKIEYLETHGEKLIQELIELATSLSLQEKQNIALFLNIVISDEAFEHQPELDREEFDMAYQKYKAEITPELIRLQKVLMPLMGQLQTALVGDQMGGYGYPQDFGGMGMEGMDGMGGMGMPGMGMSEEAVLQQLEQLRQADPQAYDQLMLMMQAQMGR